MTQSSQLNNLPWQVKGVRDDDYIVKNITYTLDCGHQSDELDGRMWCRVCAGGPRCQVDPTTRDMLKQAMDTLELKPHWATQKKARDLLREVWHRIYYWTGECPPSTKSKDGSEKPPSSESSDADKTG